MIIKRLNIVFCLVFLNCGLLCAQDNFSKLNFEKQKNNSQFLESVGLKNDFILPDIKMNNDALQLEKFTFQKKSSIDRKFKFSIIPLQSQNIGFLQFNTLQTRLDYQLNDHISLYANPFVSKYSDASFGFAQRLNMGVSSGLNYKLNEHFTFNFHGQFLPYINNIPFYLSTFYLQNSYGGSVNIKFNDKFGVLVGWERVLFRGKWMNQYYVSPYYNFTTKSKADKNLDPY
ncbi:MAG: hypothetical protein FWF52_07760 [Candidatus Azobacteroides sp.]|nr:hypothetical protein [Candidatus Azobacteroides sp.]